jgi:Rod binding domain-containing protein
MTDAFLPSALMRAPGVAHPAAIGNRGSDADGRRLKAACSEFEALFINLLIKELRATVDKSGLMDGGRAEEVYTGMLDAEMARDLSAKGGLGLAAILYRQLDSESADRSSLPVPAGPVDFDSAARNQPVRAARRP